MKLNFTIQGKPIPKARPRLTRQGMAYTPKTTRDYERLVAKAASLAKPYECPVSEPVNLQVKAYFPIPKSWTKTRRAMALDGRLMHVSKPDGSNILKSIEDGLNGVIYQDDSQIVTSHIEKHYSDTPRVEVTVATIESKGSLI